MYTNTRSFRGNKSRQSYKPRPQRGKRSAQNINPAKFINRDVASVKEQMAYEPTHSFSDFGFSPKIMQNVEEAGFITPSAIQDQTIPLAMQGKDVIGLANTGTGKTVAFLLPILEALAAKPTPGSVLIMAPTRELAQQIDAEFIKFSRGMRLYSAICVGGVNISSQLRALRRNPHIIIGTPGRLKDHLQRGTIRLSSIRTFVLDEADRMLDMGFVNDIRAIASQLPPERQTLCFSATLSDGIRAIVKDFMQDPELISVKVTETNDHIYQDVVHYNDPAHRKNQLVSLLEKAEFEKVIVFGETKHGVQRLSDDLSRLGILSGAIHGNKSQGQRNRALNDFKTNKSKVLVATDVAARGLDIPNVSHVINYDIPQTYDDYVHRIGRTGRGGKSGTALTFVKK